MSIAITDDHRALADTAADFLAKRDARGAARELLESPTEPRPATRPHTPAQPPLPATVEG